MGGKKRCGKREEEEMTNLKKKGKESWKGKPERCETGLAVDLRIRRIKEERLDCSKIRVWGDRGRKLRMREGETKEKEEGEGMKGTETKIFDIQLFHYRAQRIANTTIFWFAFSHQGNMMDYSIEGGRE